MSDSEGEVPVVRDSGLRNGIHETLGQWTFRSDFDSGNLARVCKQGGRDNAFDLWTAPDAAGTPYENGHRSWFHFSVSGPRSAGSTITLSIVNLNQQGKLYKLDMRPLVKVDGKHDWERIKMEPHTLSYVDGEGEKQFRLTWRHKFDRDHQTASFAFCYPWSLEECTDMLNRLEDRHGVSLGAVSKPVSQASPSSIYFHRETLALSLEGRKMEMLTISSHRGILEEREGPLASMPPSLAAPRPHCFVPSKQIIFVSARVHPGETPASHVMNGFLEFILRSDDERAHALRDQFVFKVVPILNPDGVVKGHYRTDSRGANLNRFYDNPDPEEHPTVWAVKSYLVSLNNEGLLHMYIDLHGHASKRGCFIYGNCLSDIDDQVQNVLYPKLVSLNCPHFEFQQCNFTEKNMKSRDKRDGLSKEGSGRVAMYKATGLIHCYTLECNYNTGRMLSRVGAAAHGEGRASPEFNGRGRPPKYTPEHWEHVGRAVAVAILDIHDCNPWSRISNCEFRSLDSLRTWVRSWVRAAIKTAERKSGKKVPATRAASYSHLLSEPTPGSTTNNRTPSSRPQARDDDDDHDAAITRCASSNSMGKGKSRTADIGDNVVTSSEGAAGGAGGASGTGAMSKPKKRPAFDKKAALFREQMAQRQRERQAALAARKAARQQRQKPGNRTTSTTTTSSSIHSASRETSSGSVRVASASRARSPVPATSKRLTSATVSIVRNDVASLSISQPSGGVTVTSMTVSNTSAARRRDMNTGSSATYDPSEHHYPNHHHHHHHHCDGGEE